MVVSTGPALGLDRGAGAAGTELLAMLEQALLQIDLSLSPLSLP